MAPKQRKSMLSRLSPRRSKKKEDYTSAVTQGSAEDPGTVGASSEEQIVVPDRGTQSAPTTPREADDEEPEPSTFGSAAAATAAAQGPKAEAPKLEVASLADVGASVAAADTAAAVATEAPAPPPRKSVSPPPKSSPRDDTPASAPPEGPPVKRSQSVSQEPAPPLQPAALARSKTDLREERASQGSPSFSTSVVSGVKSAVSGAVSTAKLAKHLTPAQIAKNARRSALLWAQRTIDKKLNDVYLKKVKLAVAADRRTPWEVRLVIHEIVDEVWEGVHMEVMRVFDKMIDGPGGGGDDDDGEEEGATPGQPVPSGRSSRASSSAPPPSVPPSPPESPPDHPGEIRGDMGRYGPDHPGAMAPPPQPGALAPPPPPASPPASPPDEPASPPVLYGSMRIVLVNGRDLKSADRNGLSDPYAYLRLAGKKRKSKTIMKTLDPDWNEEFEFSGAAADLKDLGITLMDYDRMSLTGDDKLGTVTVDLSAAIDKPHENVEFAELAVQKPGKGTLLVRATFVPGKPQIRGGDNLELGEDDPEHIDETITEAEQERLHGTLRVQLLSASNLLAADKGGTSDPYVKLTTMKGAVHKSAVVKKTLNPVWSEQTFEWTGTKTAMGLLELSVFDRDFGSAADDRLGSATINLAAAGVFDESAGVSSRRDLEATLNTRGTVQLRALWTVTADERIGGVTLDELKSSSEEQFLAEYAEDGGRLSSQEWLKRRMPWEKIRRAFTRVNVRVTMVAGRDLIAADLGGTSDPYVKLIFAQEEYLTSTVRKTVNPVWEETFEIKNKQVRELIAGPLRFEVFDDDKLSKDDSIGAATLSVETMDALINEALADNWADVQDPDGQEIWIPLPTKGYVGLRIFIDASRAHESMMSWGELANDVIIGPTQFVAQLPLVFRHSYSTATIRLTVEKANKLPAADGLDIPKIAAIQQNTGWSDPYAVIKIAGQKFNTKTINRTINPVWNESFDITALVREFTARELEIEVFDEDLIGADDSIGFTDLAVKEIAALFEHDDDVNDPYAKGKTFTLPLTQRGDIVISLALVKFHHATWAEAVHIASQPLIEVADYMTHLPSKANEVRNNHTEVKMGVTLHSAHDLLAADVNLLGGKGTSDPYVQFELGGLLHTSSTLYRTLNPVWDDETFDFCLERYDLEQDDDGNLTIEVFDHDDFNADDPIGTATLDIQKLIDAAGNGTQQYDLPLTIETKGAKGVKKKEQKGGVIISCRVDPLIKPSWTVSLWRAALPHIWRFRSFFLYYRLAYDQTIWRKIRDPWYWIMLVISASPSTVVRGAFFSVYLACIVLEIEEFQVMRFILGLKGSQFISGLLKFVKLAFAFWGCSVTSQDPRGCSIDGPGVGHSSVLRLISAVAWLQVLLWMAFLMLPFSGKLNPDTGKIEKKKAKALWAEAMDWAKAREIERAAPKIPPQSRKRRKAIERQAAKDAEALSVKKSAGGGGYAQLTDVEAPPAVTLSALEWFSTGRPLLDIMHDALMESPVKTPYENYIHPHIAWARAKYAEALLNFDAVSYPLRAGGSTNRLFSLLRWDTYAFGFCTALFFVMMVESEWTRESLESGGELDKHFVTHVVGVMVNMVHIFHPTFWTDWRTQITFQLIKLLFALTAVPFFIFTIGPTAKIFSHTDPTAWTRDGRCVKPDPNGLSAYVDWLKTDVLLPGTVHQAEIEQRFPQRDLKRLNRAVVAGEQLASSAWSKPGSAVRVTQKEKRRIDKMLSEIVTKEKASDALYKACFPDQVLVDEYVDNVAEAKRKEKEAEEEKKRRKELRLKEEETRRKQIEAERKASAKNLNKAKK